MQRSIGRVAFKTRAGAWAGVLALVTALALGGCTPAPPPEFEREPGALTSYTVEPGDTLYSIAWRYGYDYRQVAAWNDIEPPYEIYPGDRLVIVTPHYNHWLEEEPSPPPADAGGSKKTEATAQPAPPPRREASAPAKAPAKKAKPKPKPKSTRRASGPPAAWHWPTAGRVVQRFDPGNGKKGVDIRGETGQTVRSAAAGQVVYSGDGLIGYGNLVIIKHDQTYLSAYGHNRVLLVDEGEQVKARQKIAEMGQNADSGSILHFEIRRRGKPVDPLKYLPDKK